MHRRSFARTRSVVPFLVMSLVVGSIALAIPRDASAQVRGVHATLSPYAGWMLWGKEVNQTDVPLVGARGGVMFGPYVGIEGTYGKAISGESKAGPWPFVPDGPVGSRPPDPNAPVDEEIRHVGLDATVTLGSAAVAPYVLGGWQHVRFVNDDPNWGTTTFHGFEAGAGVKVRVAPRIALRFEARDIFFEFDNPPDGAPPDPHHSLLLSGGLQIALGGTTESADADSDGVSDKKDLCPDTPIGARVDLNGCPIDGDNDGVFDGIDRCDGTPVGAKVDDTGCPNDADKDGVLDGIDACADTPAGSKVDAKGCPTDADGDGVPDGLDQCANTPRGARVDAKGCTVDSDGDGVVDGVDRCPSTPAGAKVDQDGCPIEISEKEVELLDKGVITVRNIHFETAKWAILPDSYSILDEVGGILIQWPQLRIEIGGHADARGGDEYNLDLSQKRAQAVLDYLLTKYSQIDRKMFTARGYGEGVPVAPNTTVEGMARNRRVEFKVLNTEELTKERERRRLLQKNE